MSYDEKYAYFVVYIHEKGYLRLCFFTQMRPI